MKVLLNDRVEAKSDFIGFKRPEIDYILVPSGGGALVTSIGSFLKQVDPTIKVIAVEP